MLPTVGAFLTYLKGLRPRDRMGLAFGSFGWGGQAVGQVEDVMKDLKWEFPIEKIRINYIPDADELVSARDAAYEIGKKIIGET